METTKDDQIIYELRAEPEDLVKELQKMGFIEKGAGGDTPAAT
jgi:hypothetical protein